MKRTPLRSNPGKTAGWKERSQAAARRREGERARERPRSPIDQREDGCWFAKFDPGHCCDGPLKRCHLVLEQYLRDEVKLSMEERWSKDYWVEGCVRHHSRFDAGNFKISRSDLPMCLERAADRHPKVAARLTRDYGRRRRLIEGRRAA